MKARLIVLLSAAFMLCASASAQNYSVRVTYNTNLRASYSRDALVVDSAAAGDTLTVTGSRDRWLMVDRNGLVVWLAEWVPMTRVETGQVSSDIDNCCGVDRQCTSDHEWTAGYWAYQNNQCGSTVQPPQQSSTAPVNSTPANVDNCCFVDRQCTSDHDWTQGYWAYQNNQCGSPGSGYHGVQVEGSPGFLHMVERAFELLKEWAPEWYTYVVTALHKIRQDPVGSDSGIYIHSRTYGDASNIQTVEEVTSSDVVDMVGGMAHEACHVHQWNDGTATIGWRNEIGCVRAQLAASIAVDPIDRQRRWLENLIANIENPAYWWWTD